MRHRKVWIQAVVLLAVVWAVVWSVRVYAGSRKVTAESVNAVIGRAGFADWSDPEVVAGAAEAKLREEKLREIADLVNRLDFQEREKNRGNRTPEDFFAKLNTREKNLFIDLTVRESMKNFMAALDAMPPEQRRKFVEQGLREVSEGRTAEEIERAEALGEDLVQKITQEGMRAYFEGASADTKLDLAPLMNAVNETMQGLRGNQFRPRSE
jgi:hypothetical protein